MRRRSGKAAGIGPRLVDFSWGDPDKSRVVLVGKGVCFDSGGLDIKPAAGMGLMKKDMGGAACVLALARLVMESQLPVHLRVLLPAVENAISGNAYRPGDVIRTRKGLAAPRSLRLESPGTTWPAGRRRGAGCAGTVRAAAGAIRLTRCPRAWT